MNESLAHLRQSALLGNLADNEVAEILAACRPVELPSGSVVCRQGEHGESMFVILRGRVRIDMEDGHGKRRTLNHLGVGDHFGEMSMLVGSARSASVTTVMDSHLLELSRPDFERTLAEIPRFAANLSRSLGGWLRGEMSGRRRGPETMHAAIVRGCPTARSLTRQIGDALVSQGCRLTILSDHRGASPASQYVWLDPAGQQFEHDLRQRMETAVSARQRVLVDIDHTRAAAGLLKQQELVWWVVEGSSTAAQASLGRLRQLLQVAPELGGRIHLVWVLPADATLPPPTTLPLALDHPVMRVQQVGSIDPAAIRPQDVSRLVHQLRGMQVGLALGGGGARGMAHLGVLEVLEREGIYFDHLAGTSAGAIVAIGYAAGMPVKQLLELFENEMTPSKAWRWLPRAKQWYLLGAFRWGMLEGKFRRYVGQYTFDQLLLPVQTVSVDLVSGTPRIRSQGDVVDAILESINHPIFGRPILRDGEALVDGGVLMNVPVAALRNRPTDFTVAVDVGKQLPASFAGNYSDTRTAQMRRPGYLGTLLRVLEVEQNNLSTLHGSRSDVLIAPETFGFAFDDFTQGPGLMDAGRQAAEAALPALKQALAEAFSGDDAPASTCDLPPAARAA